MYRLSLHPRVSTAAIRGALAICLRFLLLLSAGLGFGPASAATVGGELKQWHDVQLSFAGPRTSETAASNPFLDFRLDVTFTRGGKVYVVLTKNDKRNIKIVQDVENEVGGPLTDAEMNGDDAGAFMGAA